MQSTSSYVFPGDLEPGYASALEQLVGLLWNFLNLEKNNWVIFPAKKKLLTTPICVVARSFLKGLTIIILQIKIAVAKNDQNQLSLVGSNMFRSSRPEVFCKIGVLRNFAKFTGK